MPDPGEHGDKPDVNAAAAGTGTSAVTMTPTPTPMTAVADANDAPRLDEPTRPELLRAAAIEQVMRSSDDDVAVLALLEVDPGTQASASALGRLMTDCPQRLVAGCPLISFVTGQDPDPHWRDAYPAAPESLHAHLEFLTALYGTPAAADPYAALEALRARSEADLPLPDLP